jgi:tetratricopeptide (TPR) repeat protein
MRFLLAICLFISTAANAAEGPLPWDETIKQAISLRKQLLYGDAERVLLGRLAVESHQEGRRVLYLWLATVHLETGRFEAAERDHTRSLSELRAAYGDRSAILLQPLLGLAWLHMETDRVKLAKRDFAQASSLQQSESSEDRLTLLHTGAMLLDALGKLSEAESEYRRTAAVTESTLGSTHETLGPILNNLGYVLMRRKQYASALPILTKAAAILAQAPAQDRIRSHMNIAMAYHGIGDEAAAERTSAAAMNLIVSVFGPGHRDVADMLYLRAAILKRLGRKREARDSLARSLEIARGFQQRTVNVYELSVGR